VEEEGCKRKRINWARIGLGPHTPSREAAKDLDDPKEVQGKEGEGKANEEQF
jgi:hypothetical protein